MIELIHELMGVTVTQEQIDEHMGEAVRKRDFIMARNGNDEKYMDARYLALLLGEMIIVDEYFGYKKKESTATQQAPSQTKTIVSQKDGKIKRLYEKIKRTGEKLWEKILHTRSFATGLQRG